MDIKKKEEGNLNKSSFRPTWCLFLGLVCLVGLTFIILENTFTHFFLTALLYENEGLLLPMADLPVQQYELIASSPRIMTTI